MVILATGWLEADPLVSVFIGVLVLASSWSILRDSTTILLEAAPSGMDTRVVGDRLARAPGVVEVHDLHVWTITSGFPALSAHVLVGRGEDCHARRLELAALLENEFGIEHTTPAEVDRHGGRRGAGSALVELGRSSAPRRHSRNEHGRAADIACAEPVESLVRVLERKGFDFGPNRDARREGEELLTVSPGEVRHGAQHPFAPEELVRERGNVAHVDARAHDDAALADVAKRRRDELA